MKLIDADKLKKALGITSEDCNKCGWGSYESCGRGYDFEDACVAIDDMPTVDAVPMVRCADCIRYRPDDDVWGRCTVMPYRMRKNDYCSYGVIDDMRKDDDDEQTKKPE